MEPTSLLQSLWITYTHPENFDWFVTTNVCYLPIVCRFAISVLFVGSFLLKPFIMRPLSLLWRRIVESDKPVFTPIFGGGGTRHGRWRSSFAPLTDLSQIITPGCEDDRTRPGRRFRGSGWFHRSSFASMISR